MLGFEGAEVDHSMPRRLAGNSVLGGQVGQQLSEIVVLVTIPVLAGDLFHQLELRVPVVLAPVDGEHLILILAGGQQADQLPALETGAPKNQNFFHQIIKLAVTVAMLIEEYQAVELPPQQGYVTNRADSHFEDTLHYSDTTHRDKEIELTFPNSPRFHQPKSRTPQSRQPSPTKRISLHPLQTSRTSNARPSYGKLKKTANRVMKSDQFLKKENQRLKEQVNKIQQSLRSEMLHSQQLRVKLAIQQKHPHPQPHPQPKKKQLSFAQKNQQIKTEHNESKQLLFLRGRVEQLVKQKQYLANYIDTLNRETTLAQAKLEHEAIERASSRERQTIESCSRKEHELLLQLEQRRLELQDFEHRWQSERRLLLEEIQSLQKGSAVDTSRFRTARQLLQQSIIDLQSQLSQKSQQLLVQQSRLKTLYEQICSTQQQLQTLRASLLTQQDKSRSLKQQLSLKEDSHKLAIQQNMQAESSIRHLADRLQRCQEEMLKERDQFDMQLAVLRSELRESQSRWERGKEEFGRLQGDYKEVCRKLVGCQDRLAVRERERTATLAQKISRMNNIQQKLLQYQQDYNTKIQECAKLHAQNLRMDCDLQYYRQGIRKLVSLAPEQIRTTVKAMLIH